MNLWVDDTKDPAVMAVYFHLEHVTDWRWARTVGECIDVLADGNRSHIETLALDYQLDMGRTGLEVIDGIAHLVGSRLMFVPSVVHFISSLDAYNDMLRNAWARAFPADA